MAPSAKPIGQVISVERLERLLGEKVIERLKVAALREQAIGIHPATPEDIEGAARWISGQTPKARSGKNGKRPRYSDRTRFTRVAAKYFSEKPAARGHFTTWCEATVKEARRAQPKG